MHDQPPFDHPFHEQPTDDPATGSAAQCGDPLQADSRQHRPSCSPRHTGHCLSAYSAVVASYPSALSRESYERRAEPSASTSWVI